VPFGLFPEVGGILPFAKTDGGDFVCWRTAGEPDEWDVVDFSRYDQGGYEHLPLGFSEYFFKVLNREVILERHRGGQSWKPRKDLRFEPGAYHDLTLIPSESPQIEKETSTSSPGNERTPQGEQKRPDPVPNALDQRPGMRELLLSLHEQPGDETTWQAIADWLDDDGQAQRAELVRVARRLRSLPVMEKDQEVRPRRAPTQGRQQRRQTADSERVVLEKRLAELLVSGVLPVAPEVANSVGMRLVLIEPGTFRMGSSLSEKERVKSEQQLHEVKLTQPFYLGVFPVTQSQYAAVMGSNPSRFSAMGEGRKVVAGLDTGDFPVECVSWEDAAEFCRRLTWMDRGSRPGLTYRLPTEAEWEYSCRGGPCSQSPFCFGPSLSSTLANFNGEFPAGGAKKGPYLARTCVVGSYPPNVFGLFDMHGNVWELCHDFSPCVAGLAPPPWGRTHKMAVDGWFDIDYSDGPAVDPTGPSDGPYRIYRGGAWGTDGNGCRAARRNRTLPAATESYLGFRVAAVRSEAP
jgi:uncharacterized protein (TIGR02996 family)